MLFKKLLICLLITSFLFIFLLAGQRPELEFRYVKVKKDDTFWKLFRDKWEIVSRINKVDKWHLIPGKTLKVPLDWELAKKYPFFPEFLEQEKGAPKLILVVIKEQFLAGYESGELKFWYPVCSGMEKGLTPDWFLKMEAEKEWQMQNQDQELTKKIREQIKPVNYPTPRGRFSVLYKDINHKSDRYPIPDGGQPMPFAVMFSWAGYGIHAWGVPKNLEYPSSGMPGWPVSHGCVRLFIEDAQKLFKWAKVGTVVVIIDSFDDLRKTKTL